MRVVEAPAEAIGQVPLAEVSALAVARDADRSVLLAVGDRSVRLAWAELRTGAARLEWSVQDLSAAIGTRQPDPQLEALAADGAGSALVVSEWPNRGHLVELRGGAVRATIDLEVPDVPALTGLRRSWLDPSGSHAEGVVMLRDGRLLVAKEKDPVALLEFGPAGATAMGWGPDRWLGPDEVWQVSAHELTVLAAWQPEGDLARLCPDLSDAAVAPDGSLLLLSDQGESIGVVGPHDPAADPFRGALTGDVGWRLRGIGAKPEGIVVLPDGDVLVACDRRKVARNLYRIESPA